MYDRSSKKGDLRFEASGALEKASLVMRDMETDSWWSIMSSNAIGGELEGEDLRELPVGEKATWGDWRARHPHTLVLSVKGEEHVENSPYANYFENEQTFRGTEIADDRLEPKASIFSFWLDDQPTAVAHEDFVGGQVFTLPDRSEQRLFVYRPKDASVYRSSDAFVIPASAASLERDALREALLAGHVEGAERLAGFDTFWYTWVNVNRSTRLLRD